MTVESKILLVENVWEKLLSTKWCNILFVSVSIVEIKNIGSNKQENSSTKGTDFCFSDTKVVFMFGRENTSNFMLIWNFLKRKK